MRTSIIEQAGPTASSSSHGNAAKPGWKQKITPASREYPDSYARLATLMNSNPEKAIPRKFGDLNMKNLLYLQAELSEVEEELYEVAKFDDESYKRDWSRLAEADDGQSRQWALVLRMRELLKEHNTALEQQTFNFGLQSPHPYDPKLLRKWLRRPDLGGQFLLGPDRLAWHEDKDDDLVTIGLKPDDDPLSKWVTDRFMVWIHNLLSKPLRMNAMVHYSED
ncbi:hypothetical protein MMC13_002347 [Lambiella insularis]|nr:hypothetical protein [Lambiella insularis]